MIKVTYEKLSWTIADGEIRGDDKRSREVADSYNRDWHEWLSISFDLRFQDQNMALARYFQRREPEVQIDFGDYEPNDTTSPEFPVKY